MILDITINDAVFSEKVFDISVTEIESVVEPESVADDVWWETVAFICIHASILLNPGV